MQNDIAKCRKREHKHVGTGEHDLSTAVFWVLLLAGLAVLGACVVVPVWTNCRMLAGQSQELSEQVEAFALRVQADQEAIKAASHDVAFNERLLIEELNYQRPGEQVLLANAAEFEKLVGAGTRPESAGPAWLRAFVEQDSRSILLFMSGGLVLFAFVYYPPKSRSGRPRIRPNVPVRPARARFIEPRRGWPKSGYST